MTGDTPAVVVLVEEREGGTFLRVETAKGGRKVWQGYAPRALMLLAAVPEIAAAIGVESPACEADPASIPF